MIAAMAKKRKVGKERVKNPAAVALAERRMEALSPERRAEIAHKAGRANGAKWAAIRAAKQAATRQDLTTSGR